MLHFKVGWLYVKSEKRRSWLSGLCSTTYEMFEVATLRSVKNLSTMVHFDRISVRRDKKVLEKLRQNEKWHVQMCVFFCTCFCERLTQWHDAWRQQHQSPCSVTSARLTTSTTVNPPLKKRCSFPLLVLVILEQI